MTRALARRTSESSAAKPIRPIRDPSITPPVRVQRTEKLPGSVVLSLNKWWVVQEDGTLREKLD